MSLGINHNITAMNAWRSLKTTDTKMSNTMERLSSGLRINRAADDPAGLVISEKMRAQLSGLEAAVKNSEKAINMIQTAEGALDQVQKLLDKMRQLAIDSANSGLNDESMLQANQDELDEAIKSIHRIADYTQFGTKKLLDGTLGTNIDVATGSATFAAELASASFSGINDTDKSGTVSIDITDQAERGSLSLTLYTATAISGTNDILRKSVAFTINGVTISVASGIAMRNVARTINGYSDTTGVTASWASATNTLTLDTIQYGSDRYIAFQNNTSGTAFISTVASKTDFGVDYKATVTYADGNTSVFDQGKGLSMVDSLGNTIVLADGDLTTANGSLTIGTLDVNEAVFQVGANEGQTVSVSINSMAPSKLGVSSGTQYGSLLSLGSAEVVAELDAGATANFSLGALKQGDAAALADAIRLIDVSIDEVSNVRGALGAIQADNLQVQLDSLRVAYENLQAAEATIRDTDMSLDMAQFTKYQIMLQAGTAMLAQANQIPNNILQLLK